ncbi:MAG: hypothetical protein J6V53_02790 [Alphaproteobacteria bacterium]|nr:hypothetical protein [Alphaproteobacteria bacterium]
MRKYFLCSAILVSCLIPFSSFANSGLFPELQKKEKPAPAPVSENPETFDLFNEEANIDLNKNPEEEFKEIEETVTNKPIKKPTPKKESEKTEKNDKKKKDQMFEIHPHNIRITTPPTGVNSQFCTGQLTLENKSEYPLSQLKLLISYGGINVPYEFSGVPANDTVTGAINLLGPMCQDLLKIVPVKASVCKAEGISDAECKSMVKYVIK